VKDKAKAMIAGVFLVLFGVIGGTWGLGSGFDRIQKLRQIERVPLSKAGAVLPGTATISALTKVDQNTVSSKHTKTDSLYYRYTKEIEKEDSDGDRYWSTVEDVSKSTDFWLYDETGKILLSAKTHGAIDWVVGKSFEHTSGSVRYREWRIEPGDKVFTFGRAVNMGGEVKLIFDLRQDFTAIISNQPRSQVQSSMGGKALLYIAGGLFAASLGVLGVAFLLGIHRLIFYLGALGLATTLILVHLSLKMMNQDLSDGLKRLTKQRGDAEKLVEELHEHHQLKWSGWIESGDFQRSYYLTMPESSRLKLQEYRLSLALNQWRLEHQMKKFPENVLRRVWGMDIPESISQLPANDKVIFESRKRTDIDTVVSGWWSYLVVLLGFFLTIGFTYLGFRALKTKRLIENIPSTPSVGVSVGMAETTGTIVLPEGEVALESPYTFSPCVWYSYHKEERQGSGKNARWVTLDKRETGIEFICRDQEGDISVLSDKADIITNRKTSETRGGYRYTEKTLNVDDPLYILALAAINPKNRAKLQLKKGETSEPFILSNYTESEVMYKKARAGMLYLNFAFGCLLTALLLSSGRTGGFAATDFLVAALAAPFYMSIMVLVLHFNDLIFLRKRCERNWANIQISLRKRRNLVGNIQKLVKRYFEHEKDILKQTSVLRKKFQDAVQNEKRIANYYAHESAFRRSVTVKIEDYPQLKSDKVVAKLMSTLKNSENEIALLRKGFNDSVEVYNARISTVPDIFFARMAGFKRQSFMGFNTG